MSSSLQDRHILIIGARGGIGATLAARAEEAGAIIYRASRGQEAGDRAVAYDVLSDGPLPEGFLPAKLHGLVYCPGTINLKPIQRLTSEELEGEFRLNVVGAFNVLQQSLKALKAAEGGASVVFFGTVAARLGMPFHASIAAAKGGLEAMARSLAAELSSYQVRVNVVAPSLTDTPLAGNLLDKPEKREAADKRHPLGRVGTPEDIAAAALYLLSPESSWVTGQTLGVDGGMGTLK